MGLRYRCGRISVSTRSPSRSSACRWWRSRCRSHRCRSGSRSLPRPGARTWRYASPMRWRGGARWRRGGRWGDKQMDIDLPDVIAEVTAAFEAYERALVANDVAALDAMFHDDPRTIRFGSGESLFGYAQIKAFRAWRSPAGLARTLSHTVITAYGRDVAIASTLLDRKSTRLNSSHT